MTVRQVLSKHFAMHTGSWLRAILYCMIAFLGVWATALGDKVGPELWAELAGRWPALLIMALLQTALTLRAFIDQHVSNAKVEAATIEAKIHNPSGEQNADALREPDGGPLKE